jgi:hypothetical protein
VRYPGPGSSHAPTCAAALDAMAPEPIAVCGGSPAWLAIGAAQAIKNAAPIAPNDRIVSSRTSPGSVQNSGTGLKVP